MKLIQSALVVIFAVALVWTVGSISRAQDVSIPTVTPILQRPHTARPTRPRLARTHWLAECSTDLSISAGTDLGSKVTVKWIRKTGQQITIALRKNNWTYMTEAVRLGSREAGWIVWQMSGPAGLKTLMTNSPKCRQVIDYTAVLSLPKTIKDWLSRRLTCYGTATWKGRTYRRWPCIWSYNGRSGSVTNLEGVGPAIDSGYNYPVIPPRL